MRAGGGAWSSTCPHSNSGLRDAQGDTARPNACSSFILLKGFGAEWSLCPESRNPVLPPSVQEPPGGRVGAQRESGLPQEPGGSQTQTEGRAMGRWKKIARSRCRAS